jgi:glycosyltransferase involved in cell wall biosynthesis
MAPHTNSKEKLKVTLLTTSFFRYEGDFAGHFIYKYAQQLARFDYNVKVIAPHDSEVKEPDKWCDVKVEYFKYFLPQSFQTLAYGAGMISRIKQNGLRLLLIPFFLASFFLSALRASRDSDLLQAYWIPAGMIALLVKWFTKVPVAINLWGSDFLLLRIPGFAFICRNLLRGADAIICESDYFRDLLHQLGLLEGKTIILNIGGMSPVKGQKYLVEAIPEIIAKDKHVQFIFVGDGEVRKELESLVSASELNPYVLFAGMQNVSQIPLWLNAADIFVLPSLSEGNPNVLLEAMACGLAVVSTAVGGIPDMIRDKQEGLLVLPKSPQALARQITTLIRDKTLRKKLGQNGLKMVQANYGTWKRQSAKLKTIYENLTAK